MSGFLGAGVTSGTLAISVGFPNNTALLMVTAGQLICAGFAVTGARWMPVLLTLVSGVFLYQIATQPFVAYHLTNPKEGGFLEFVLDLIITAFVFIAFGASIGGAVQNYAQGSQEAPDWFSTILTAAVTTVVGIVIGAILIGAIVQPGGPAGTTFTNGVPTVHMSAANFHQSFVGIAKGSKLLLQDDVSVLHILANGSWQNDQPKPMTEPGAPIVDNIQVNGTGVEIGPFTAAGTYHLYCPVHQGMNLTIIVQ
jgi:hypothetical protein